MSETRNVDQGADKAVSKHTPGPWEWRDSDDLRQAKSTRDDGRYGAQVIGACYDYDRGAWLDMTDADRDLIAAAPLQHDALKMAEQYLAKRVGHLPTSEGYKVLTTIREAIAAGVLP